MKQKKIDQKAVQEYLGPQLKTLKSFLMGLNLVKSVQVVIFLQYLVNLEIRQHLAVRKKTDAE